MYGSEKLPILIEEIMLQDLEGKTLDEKIGYVSNIISDDLSDITRKKYQELAQLGELCRYCNKWSLNEDWIERPDGYQETIFYNLYYKPVAHKVSKIIKKECPLCGNAITYLKRID